MREQSSILVRVITTILGGFAGAAGAACTIGFGQDELTLLVIGVAGIVGALCGAIGGPSGVRWVLSIVSGW